MCEDVYAVVAIDVKRNISGVTPVLEFVSENIQYFIQNSIQEYLLASREREKSVK